MHSKILDNRSSAQTDAKKREDTRFYDVMLARVLSNCSEPLTAAQKREQAHFEADQRDAADAAAKAKADKERKNRPIRKLPSGFSMLLPALIRSAVFSTARVKTKSIDQEFLVPRFDSIDGYEGGSVRYRGPQLNQFHKRVVLGLIERGSVAGELEVTFHAQEFLISIGHSAESDAVAALARVLGDLVEGTFKVCNYAGDKGCIFKVVYDVEWDKRTCTVKLNKRVADALKTRDVTFIPMAVRKGLTDGLQTALLDLLYSTTQATFAIADLATLWGRKSGPKSVRELGRELGPALERLLAAGAIEGFERSYGKVTVARSYKFPRKED